MRGDPSNNRAQASHQTRGHTDEATFFLGRNDPRQTKEKDRHKRPRRPQQAIRQLKLGTTAIYVRISVQLGDGLFFVQKRCRS
jgi:hypothetical protein